MTTSQLTDGGPAATAQFTRVPSEFARYVIDTVAASRILGVEPEQVADLADGTLPQASHPELGPLYDYVDLINLALFSSRAKFCRGDPAGVYIPTPQMTTLPPFSSMNREGPSQGAS